jgi:predicted MFS family arabinose efflux permease
VQGRINSSFRFVAYGSEAVGGALGGVALATLGPQRLLWVVAAGLTLLVVATSRTRLHRA